MPIEGEYEPSAWAPVAEQVELYERTGGAEGREWMGGTCIILTTKGAKTGKVRKTPLMRVEHEGSYAVVASLGGAPDHPVWYHNFLEHPEVDLQDGPEPHAYRARIAEGAERAEWWERCVAQYSPYAEYQEKTDREIPVFLLERV